VRLRGNTQSWIGLLLTLFLVLVLPSCWYGTLSRAVVASDIPANSGEEERDEHEQEHATEVARRSSPPPARPATAAVKALSAVGTPAPMLVRVASVAPPVHPSLYSVRRQQ
jgi:hypothetical protein